MSELGINGKLQPLGPGLFVFSVEELEIDGILT